jgi:hypothetical protein
MGERFLKHGRRFLHELDGMKRGEVRVDPEVFDRVLWDTSPESTTSILQTIGPFAINAGLEKQIGR